MKIIVTGAAGFIGSSLCEELLKHEDCQVIGIDAFLGPTKQTIKEKNLSHLLTSSRFTFLKENLLTIQWERILEGVDYIYHLAGMPGVRSSWGDDFALYSTYNIEGTQRLLEACKQQPSLKNLIFASTSSVYGEKTGKVSENAKLSPLSPYGITKLTAEHLCYIYQRSFGLPVTILRYFTVYGPRQRSDMAFHLFIQQMLEGRAITIFGDGSQTRDFTYIDDCIQATAAVMHSPGVIGEVINIGGKERASIREVVSIIEDLLGQKAIIKWKPSVHGEPSQTWADISKAKNLLDYNPSTDLKTGLRKEIAYLTALYIK
ncbi:NAD-dependent epimerase/dehydratase family protein [Halalkalibacter oceani]|uniref:NAD-dependent epimerase/dehydratase family protein n=1 Tax=Halalkalibacter oceani TaxID=1653776 RepID=UPI0033946567